MPGPFTPADDLIGPLVHQIALFIQAQIPSIAHVYEQATDISPVDNSVLLPLVEIKVTDAETTGKLKLHFTFQAFHVFRRKQLSDNILLAYTYISPWLKLLSAWPNQNLGGLAQEVDASKLKVTQMASSGQPMYALTVIFDVVTEFNIILS